jgi:NAD(P)H-flavin reductase
MSHAQLPLFSCQLIHQTALVDNIIELSLSRPEGFNWQVGDYLWLGSDNGDFKPFSIANLPNESVIKLQIALVPALNEWLTHLLAQETLHIKGAVNQYHWPENQQQIMMLAGGTGITPLLALLQGHQDRLEHQLVTLYWGVRRSEHLFAQVALDALSANYPNFRWQAVVSDFDDNWTGLTGLLPDVLAQQSIDLTNHHILICGPWPMVTALKSLVLSLGAKAENIQ